jgi:hypothetical protein
LTERLDEATLDALLAATEIQRGLAAGSTVIGEPEQ